MASKSSPKLTPLPLSFYQRPTLTVARELLGKVVRVNHQGVRLEAEIHEVEAYLGQGVDPASHAFRGQTKRNTSMFLAGGACYVYLSYGVSYCVNVVTGKPGHGEAVLIRAAKPLKGIETMMANRHFSQPREEKAIKQLLSGPGKLTQALGIGMWANGLSFLDSKLTLCGPGTSFGDDQVEVSSRIGISKGVEFDYRFYVKDSMWLSRKRPQPTTLRKTERRRGAIL